MPILSVDVNAPGMSGVKPKAIFIDTNDTADEVVVSGYLDHIVAQGTPISNSEIALVTTRPSPNSSDITTAWYGITFSNGQWSLVAQGGGGGGVILPTTPNHFAIYADSDGLLYQDAATVVNDGNIQANGILFAGNPDGGQAGEVHVAPNAAESGSIIIQAVNVVDGDHDSIINNSADLTNDATYTLPVPPFPFDQTFTMCGVPGVVNPTGTNVAVWGNVKGTLLDGGPLPQQTIYAVQNVFISSAELLALDGNGHAFNANASPGVNGLSFVYARIRFTYNTTPYANTTGDFYFSYDSAGLIPCSAMLPQSVFTATEDRMFIIYQDPTLNTFAKSDTVGDLYFVSNNNLTNGDSSILVQLYYTQTV